MDIRTILHVLIPILYGFCCHAFFVRKFLFAWIFFRFTVDVVVATGCSHQNELCATPLNKQADGSCRAKKRREKTYKNRTKPNKNVYCAHPPCDMQCIVSVLHWIGIVEAERATYQWNRYLSMEWDLSMECALLMTRLPDS